MGLKEWALEAWAPIDGPGRPSKYIVSGQLGSWAAVGGSVSGGSERCTSTCTASNRTAHALAKYLSTVYGTKYLGK